MEFFGFWETDTFPLPKKQRKMSPASSVCSQHQAWASVLIPSCQTKIRYTLQPYQISVTAMAHRWVIHYVHLVHEARLIADTLGNECPTVKGLSREDPSFSERQLESQSVFTMGISARSSWAGVPGTNIPLLQLAGGCNGFRQRNQVVNDHGVCAPLCLSAARLVCCVVDWWVWRFHCLQKNKKESAPVCFSSISYYLSFRTCSAVQGTVVDVKRMKGIIGKLSKMLFRFFSVLCALPDLSVSPAGNITVTQAGFQLSSCLLEIKRNLKLTCFWRRIPRDAYFIPQKPERRREKESNS